MPGDPQDEARRELSSWKQVASHLGVSIRTAQTYERKRRLPVRRLAGPGGRISSTVEELNNWRIAASAPPSTEGETPADTTRQGEQKRSRFASRRVLTALAILLIVGGVITTWELRAFILPGEPTSYRLETNTLVVMDGHGRECWRRVFPSGIREPSYAGTSAARNVWIGDLDDDGEQEVLFVLHSPEATDDGTSPLICFGRNGVERWRFAPRRIVRTTSEKFTPAYKVSRFLVGRMRRNSPTRIVVSSVHTPSYPCQIALLAADGHLLGEYWHSGQLTQMQLADLDGDGKNELYAAGINNARKAATLVVLDPERLSGAAQEVPAFQFLELGPPIEIARIMLPRTCLNATLATYNIVTNLFVSTEGIDLYTEELAGEGAGVVHHFSNDLREYRGIPSDGYEQVWRLHHTLKQLRPACAIGEILKPTFDRPDRSIARTNPRP